MTLQASQSLSQEGSPLLVNTVSTFPLSPAQQRMNFSVLCWKALFAFTKAMWQSWYLHRLPFLVIYYSQNKCVINMVLFGCWKVVTSETQRVCLECHQRHAHWGFYLQLCSETYWLGGVDSIWCMQWFIKGIPSATEPDSLGKSEYVIYTLPPSLLVCNGVGLQ